MDRGYIHAYIGNGKGKTTAALGLALRAVGCGYKVKFFQFLKGMQSGEIESVKRFGDEFQIIRIERESKKFFWQLTKEEKEKLRKQIQEQFKSIEQTVQQNNCQLIVLDEVLGAIENQLIDIDQIVHLLQIKSKHVELVLTGRNLPEELVHQVDLITEMKPIKHYYEQGVSARKGIEY